MHHVFGLGGLLLCFGFYGVEFEVAKDGFGTLDDGFREACEAGSGVREIGVSAYERGFR